MTGGAISYGEVAVRLLIAVALCGLIGFEREARDQAAGLRTHIILGVGATLFTLVSAYGFEDFRAAPGQAEGGATFDPTRIAAQIVSGVGFLGAGAILRYGRDVRGVTTAATLWTVAAIGMAVGAGYLFGAALTTAVVFLTLFVLRKFQRLVMPRLRTDFAVLEIDFGDGGEGLPRAMGALERHDIRVRTLDAELEGSRARYTIRVRLSPNHGAREALGGISALPGVERVALAGLHGLE